MRLHPGELPAVEINKKSAPYRLIGQLARQNYIPSYQDAPHDLKWLVEGEGDCQPDPSIHIIDLLGVYQSKDNKIILYDLLIQLCALHLGIDSADLRRIVLLHELSHAVTHRGLDSDNRIWECFDIADKEAKEYFAQIYTYKFLQDTDQSCLAIMDKLSEVQPDVYQTYRESTDTDVTMINQEFLKARRVVPNGFELYPELLKEKWEIHFDNLVEHETYVGHSSFHGDPRHPGPKSIFRTETEGTQFSITANRINIKSYDYRPSSNEFSVESTLRVYCLILDHMDEIKQESDNQRDEEPLFYIVFDDGQYYLNLANPFACALWTDIVAIIEHDYPVLSQVLRGYKLS